ncbi:MAG: phosphonoacetaldehyde reductase [Agathobacter sp.]
MGQKIIYRWNREELCDVFQTIRNKSLMLVAGSSFDSLSIKNRLEDIWTKAGISMIRFRGFSPNPKYEDIIEGTRILCENKCDGIIAGGGGSAIDVAKCIKLFATMDPQRSFLEQTYNENKLFFAAVPTTAGTGSESTQFAVIYKDGEKLSIDHESLLPQYVLLDGSVLTGLPQQIKKASFCDALSHAVESYWSVRATDESKGIAAKAIRLLLQNRERYLNDDEAVYQDVIFASNLAGQAINLTRTTAAHAMCYKFTSLFDVPHGHAVMLFLPEVWQFMLEHMEQCRHPRGTCYLERTLNELAKLLGQCSIGEAIQFLKDLRCELGLLVPDHISDEQMEYMVRSVNVQRLKNFPVEIREDQLREIYKQIVRGNENERSGSI